MFKRVVLSSIGTLALLGLLGLGVALAAHPNLTSEPPQEAVEGMDWFAIAAETIGVEEDALWEALDDGQSIAQIAQARGVEPQTVIEAIVAAEQPFLAEEARLFVEESWEEWEGVDWFTVAAETIGVEEDALWEALDGGQSIAEFAQAQGADSQKVIDAIVAAEREFVAGLVAEGEITQEEADEWLAELEEEARLFVEESWDMVEEPIP